MGLDDWSTKLQNLAKKTGEIAQTASEKTGEIAQTVAKASGELAQTAAKKSIEVLEITKLNVKITEEKSAIKARYEKMGKYIYEKYADCAEQAPEDFKDFLNDIKEYNTNISNFKEKINEIKASGTKEEFEFEEFEESGEEPINNEGEAAENTTEEASEDSLSENKDKDNASVND